MADPYRWGDVTPAGAARVKALREARGTKTRISPAWSRSGAVVPARAGRPAVSLTSIDFGGRAVLCIGDRQLHFSGTEMDAIASLFRRDGGSF